MIYMRKAQSMIQGVLAVAIIVTSSIIVVNMVTPTLKEGQKFQEFERAKQMMLVVDNVIRELALEASGASRSVQIISDFGSFSVLGNEDRILFNFESEISVLEPGTSQKIGNLLISAGKGLDAVEKDVDNDGNNDLVLENEAVLFAVKKIGSRSVYAPINTSQVVVLIKNKYTETNVTNPVTRIYIDDELDTTYGTGFTELTRIGTGLSEGSIRIFVNSTGGRQYDAFFRLSSSKDFVELEVRNIK
jgi:hypothetical protein